MKGLAATIALALSIVLAHARTVTLKAVSSSEEFVVVWRDAKARVAGNAMIGAGINKSNPDLLVPLAACLVEPGTQVVVADHSWSDAEIIVVSGPHQGCRGFVARDRLDGM